MSKFTPEYTAHLEAIDKAQEVFENNKNTDTATKLSNLKNKCFKKKEEIFTLEYLRKKHKGIEGDYETEIQYEPGMYNHRVKKLVVTELE